MQSGEPVDDVAALRARIAEHEATIENLQQALTNARTIGTAIGIVMVQEQTTSDDALALLVHRSQKTHTKLAVIAERIVSTGGR